MKMKKISALMLAFVMVIAFTGCSSVKKAEKIVSDTFESLKVLDFETSGKYLDLDAMQIGDEESGLSTQLIASTLFGKLSYEIVSTEEIDKENVNVKTKITAIELEPFMQTFIESVLKKSFENLTQAEMTEAEVKKQYEEIFAETAKNPNLAMKTQEVDIKVVKKDGKWIIEPDEAFTMALLGQ